jgi:phosphatidylglycerophosphate synthase
LTRPSYTVADLRNAYAASEGVDFYSTSFMVKLIRPVSFYFTILFLRIGVTANQTTFLSWIAVVAGCGSYAFVPSELRWVPLALVLTWALLDYIDGNIARVTATQSLYGHFIDVVGAYWFLAFLPFFMGVGLYYQPEYSLVEFFAVDDSHLVGDPGFILILGAFAALANTLVRLTAMRMQATFDLDPRAAASAPGRSSKVAFAVTVIEASISPRGFYFPFLVLATLFQRLEWFLAFYAVAYGGALLAYTIWYAVGLHPRRHSPQTTRQDG